MRRTLVSITLIVALAIATMLPGCSTSEATQQTGDGGQKLVKTVVVESPKTQEMGLTITEGVTLAADESGLITSQVTAKLEKWYVTQNQYVKAGDPIARLDSTDYEISLEQARLSLAALEAQFSSVDKDYTRLKALLENGGIAQTKYDAIAAQHEALQNQIKAASKNVTLLKRKVDQATPRAPFDGVITGKLVPLGKYVMATMPGGGDIATIEKINRLKISFNASEMYFSEVDEKDVISLFIPTMNKTIEAVIDSKGKSINALKTFSIIAYVDNADLSLPAGLFAVATITTEAKARTLVSPTAVKVTGNRTGEVYAVEDGKVKAIAVITGFSFEQGIEVVGQIPAKIIKDVSGIIAGEAVSPIEE